ncbi:OLC1v1009030C1 [Oldenlandia corymbosa var. corymbosa]|uniref:OLC1v1009030C1 n=1 Tax=Oldenlandia corymbosa var. corymbosa TaxID=529605 RepID=A0AAV1DN03_OLDCO|nr:OLC1v1009030C1 [Oldenlandia corymbosa var. corymbosa]
MTEEVVGFQIDAKSIINRLRRGSKQLRIVTILGMPRLGKTTLATKVYNDHSISGHFSVCARTTMSETVNKMKMLLDLRKQTDPEKFSEVTDEMTEQDLADKVRRSLKGRPYLILLDDVWDIEAWDSLQESFPDDSMGSRILLTSRCLDISPQSMLDENPHEIRPLNEEESLELFQKKCVAAYGPLPPLGDLGTQIANFCKGLPLTILIVAGFLALVEAEDWAKVVESKVFFPHVRSLRFMYKEVSISQNISFAAHIYKLLRVLDLEQIDAGSVFPNEIGLLVQLAFLVIRGDPAIDRFRKKNRYSSSDLYELETISGLLIYYKDGMEGLLKKFPNIRKLKCELSKFDGFVGNIIKVVVPDYLNESAEITSHVFITTWRMEEEEFSKLRILKLKSRTLLSWSSDSDNQLGCLEKLVLNFCSSLTEMPICLDNISTLTMIEVAWCSDDVVESVKEIEEVEQEDLRNSDLKQPAFDHPLLKNHTIHTAPSFYPQGIFPDGGDSTNQITQLWQLKGSCPEGTIPIRRTKTDQEVINKYAKKRPPGSSSYRSSSSTNVTEGHEHVGAHVHDHYYHGAKASINVWQPYVQNDGEFSLAQIWVLRGSNSNLNTIEAGWQVFPGFYQDNRTRLFIYWTYDDYQHGCYNLMCPGFVQVSKRIVVGGTFGPVSTYHGDQFHIDLFIWKDSTQKSWWVSYQNVAFGYWPDFLFTNLKESADEIQWGGEVVNKKPNDQHTKTQMGSGHFAHKEGHGGSSYFKNLQVLDEFDNLRPAGEDDEIYTLVDSEADGCYDIALYKNRNDGDHFYFGGPGRNPKCP